MKRIVMAALGMGGLLTFLPAFSAGDQPFSRSRWIAERVAKGVRFSGGVLPSDLPFAGQRPFVLPLSAEAGLANIRVSQDIVPGPYGNAQPETQTEPHIAVNPANDANVFSGYQDNRFSDGGARALTYGHSADGGRTWYEAMLPRLTLASGGKFERASDPWVAFGPDNRAYYVSLAFNESTALNGIYVNASADGGRTFKAPVAVHTTTADFDDKEAMVVDTYDDSPYRGRIYVGWDSNLANGQQVMYVSRSADKGKSYSAPVALRTAGANIGIIPLVGPGGVVYAIWSSWTGGSTMHVISKSTDGGVTWSEPRNIATVRSAGVPELRTGDGLPMAAVDRISGEIYVVWQDARFTPGVDQVVITRSTNGGEKWSKPMRVSDGPGASANFTPAVAVNGLHEVAVSYYSLRNDPQSQYLVDEYIALSADRGKTFGASRRVSARTYDVRDAAYARGYFLGDYQGIAGGSALFHPLWIATTKASKLDPSGKQPDAFTSRVRR